MGRTSEKRFRFSKETPVVIYGCSKFGILIYHRLLAAGYLVPNFIDIKALEWNNVCNVDERTVPVYQLEAYHPEEVEPIIFIAIRNSVEQTNVAKSLWRRGLNKAIFFPMLKSNAHNCQDISCLRSFYTEFTEGKFDETVSLPTLNLLWKKDIFEDYAIIQKNGTDILAWVPIALIHFYSVEYGSMFSKVTQRGTEKYDFWDKNVFQLKWINELFRFFISGDGDLEYYMSMEKSSCAENSLKENSSRENQLWYADRQNCIDFLSSGLNMERDFMLRSAIPVRWNDKGYFNIVDGSHRLAFFNCMEMQMVPAQISLKDYEKWVNYGVLNQVLAFVRENGITSFEAPIPHPWFYQCEAKEDRFGRTILKCMFEWLDGLKLGKNFSVLDTNPGAGYYLQYFARNSETGKIVGIVKDQLQSELITHFNKLFYLDKRIRLIQNISEAEGICGFDVVLMLKTLCAMEDHDKVNYIKCIESKAKNLIVWESGIDYETEKNLIMEHSRFKHYIFLKRTLSDNIVREVGIFLREGN